MFLKIEPCGDFNEKLQFHKHAYGFKKNPRKIAVNSSFI